MVLTADDVANAEVDVIRTGGEVVGGHAVGTEKREVFDVVRRFHLLAVHCVIEADWLAGAARNTEAQGEGLSGLRSAVALLAGKLAHAGIEKPGLIGSRFFSVADVGGS